jgi:hypothetical protein
VHPHWFAFPPPAQVSGAVQLFGHWSTLPQPSSIWPHWAPWPAHVIGTHVPLPHLSVPPAPQVWPVPHLPQSMVPPQPSGMVPHCAPIVAQVIASHLH